jgi:integrase
VRIERDSASGVSYALRFRAYGKRRYITVGSTEDGWTRKRAELELANTLADVRRGIWREPEHAPTPVAREEPTFHEFASEWIARRETEGLAERTLVDLRGSLSNHLLPFFKSHRLSEITAQEIDRYTTGKARERTEIEERRKATLAKGERFNERGLSNGSINHTLRHLAQVLETAVDYGLLDSNPASGKRRRLKASTPARPWVEPEQLPVFLESADGVGRVLLAILAGAGLRIGEALALRWRDVDLGTGSLHVLSSKTEKGVREVHLSPALREQLALRRADAEDVEPGDFVVHTSTGGRQNPSNLRRDVVKPAVEAANATLEELGIAQSGAIGFHSLRRTYASLRCACGDDVRYTADQLGHEDPRFTLRCYARATSRRDRLAPQHRVQFDRALDWARMGTSEPLTVPPVPVEATENPA